MAGGMEEIDGNSMRGMYQKRYLKLSQALCYLVIAVSFCGKLEITRVREADIGKWGQ